MTLYFRPMKVLKRNVSLSILLTGLAAWPTLAQTQTEGRSAYQTHIQLLEEKFFPHKIERQIRPPISWNARQAGTSSLITRMMSPSAQTLRKLIDSLPPLEQASFLSDFFYHYLVTGKYRIDTKRDGTTVDLAFNVVDQSGQTLSIDLGQFDKKETTPSLHHLRKQWEQWLAMTRGRPFSFLSRLARDKIFLGQIEGLGGLVNPKNNSIFDDYEKGQRPLFGTPEKYVEQLMNSKKGWDLRFKAQSSYARFHQMLTEIQSHNSLYRPSLGMPQWQKLIFEADSSLEKTLAETVRWSWALYVLDEMGKGRSVTGKTLEKLNAPAEKLIPRESIGNNRRRYAVTFKFQTDTPMRGFLLENLAARIISGDWQNTNDLDFRLNPSAALDEALSQWPKWNSFSQRAQDQVRERLLAGRENHHFIPFWNWEQAPFLSAQKKALLKEYTHSYLDKIAHIKARKTEKITEEVNQFTRQWIENSNLADDIKTLLMPLPAQKNLDEVLHFRPFELAAKAKVDVNAIDLGLEYTGNFPLVDKFVLAHVPWGGKLVWGKNFFSYKRDTLKHRDRRRVMQNVLKDILREFGGDENAIFPTRGGHGHNLGYGYTGRDAYGREWGVDWDGVLRDYSFLNRKALKKSVGRGHLELITPKFTPRGRELKAIYEIFKKHNLTTLQGLGQGHINVDLAAFEGHPRALARFLALFHEHQNILCFLFKNKMLQHRDKFKVANGLIEALKDFQGNENQLKELLYNHRYFNTIKGRKTRYTEINLIDYFQDVIPEEFISQDSDTRNPYLPWRRQFKVNPDSRRMELRFFQAPKTSFEAALHIRTVRAMLSAAFNQDFPLSGEVQEVNFRTYLNNPEQAPRDLRKLCMALKLNCRDYYLAMIEAFNDTDLFYQFIYPHLSKYIKPPQYETNWGNSLKRPRPRDQALYSHNRVWVKGRVYDKKPCLEIIYSLFKR